MQNFLTWDVDLPTSEDGIDTRCFGSAYVGELMKEAIGLRGNLVCGLRISLYHF